jgi:tyrosyl-tRNA synthetase
MDQIDELLTRGVTNIIPSKDKLDEALRSGTKLNVYLGIDPTSTHIHLGHATHLRRLQQLANLGHHVTFLIGDFTALIGDTSDKESERPILTSNEIEANWQTYKSQAEKVVDFSTVTIKRNSEWLGKLSFEDIVKLCQSFSLNDFISRELIKKRLTEGLSIRLDEVLYPIMQGYDSYHMDTDLQVGGTDQTFNMQAGRTLQKKNRGKESFVITGEFLEGTDGRKMSKSWGNAIWLDDTPNDMYGKVMSLKDELINRYFLLATNLSIDQIPTSGHPMDQKKQLAHRIVMELYDESTANSAQTHFESTFQKGETPTDIPTVTVSSSNIIDVLVETGLASSKSDARRLIDQGAVQVNSQKVTSSTFNIQHSDTVKVGHRFTKIKFSEKL